MPIYLKRRRTTIEEWSRLPLPEADPAAINDWKSRLSDIVPLARARHNADGLDELEIGTGTLDKELGEKQ